MESRIGYMNEMDAVDITFTKKQRSNDGSCRKYSGSKNMHRLSDTFDWNMKEMDSMYDRAFFCTGIFNYNPKNNVISMNAIRNLREFQSLSIEFHGKKNFRLELHPHSAWLNNVMMTTIFKVGNEWKLKAIATSFPINMLGTNFWNALKTGKFKRDYSLTNLRNDCLKKLESINNGSVNVKLSASNLDKKNKIFSGSDPYAVLKSKETEFYKTEVIISDLNPKWVDFQAVCSSVVDVEVFDWNRIMSHSQIGSCQIDFEGLKKSIPKTIDLISPKGKKAGELTIEIEDLGYSKEKIEYWTKVLESNEKSDEIDLFKE
jgi:hypothetical protein